eukprot:1182815-Prorocentrum_minimum.AAC.2
MAQPEQPRGERYSQHDAVLQDVLHWRLGYRLTYGVLYPLCGFVLSTNKNIQKRGDRRITTNTARQDAGKTPLNRIGKRHLLAARVVGMVCVTHVCAGEQHRFEFADWMIPRNGDHCAISSARYGFYFRLDKCDGVLSRSLRTLRMLKSSDISSFRSQSCLDILVRNCGSQEQVA